MTHNSPQPQLRLHLPDSLVQNLSNIGTSTSQSQPDFGSSQQWIEFSSGDGGTLLYYDPVTREIWGEGPDGDSDDFGDDDINAANRLAVALDDEEPTTRSQSPPSNERFSSRPGPSTISPPVLSSRLSTIRTRPDLPSTSSGHVLYTPAGPAFDHSDPSHQFSDAVESDWDQQPRHSTAKGKQRADRDVRMSENELSPNDDEMVKGSMTPTPRSDHPATVEDMRHLCDTILTGQREMTQMIIDGLRPELGRSVGSNLQDAGNDGDVEEGYPGVRSRGGNGSRRRDHSENELSRKIRAHLRKLVTPDKWLKSTVTGQEVDAFNPNLGPCCHPAHFRVRLEGTTCDKWNKSAIAVFVEDFLRAHPEYPFEEPAVREMVRIKSRATLDSAIRKYRRSLVSRSAQAAEEMRKQKNCQERKRKLFNRRCKVTEVYPTLAPHRKLLVQLTLDGMSSDEERIVGLHAQYDIIEPVWRADAVTAWLRIFDALYSQARIHGLLGNQHGSVPRMRLSSGKQSASRKFVPGLPRNAYDDVWFGGQPHPEYTVQPGPPVRYIHTARTLELACKH